VTENDTGPNPDVFALNVLEYSEAGASWTLIARVLDTPRPIGVTAFNGTDLLITCDPAYYPEGYLYRLFGSTLTLVSSASIKYAQSDALDIAINGSDFIHLTVGSRYLRHMRMSFSVAIPYIAF
jgi:hypothetical protein